MIHVKYRITLAGDAEPGSGIADESFDQRVPRDARNSPYLRASHIKGLVRDRLSQIVRTVDELRETADALVERALGRGGCDEDTGAVSRVHFGDARIRTGDCRTMAIARTSIDDRGTADASTLRVTEAIPVGTVFEGDLWVDAASGSTVDLAVRLGLASIEAIGAHRTRGSGSCRVDVEGDDRPPGALLRALAAAARGEARAHEGTAAAPAPARTTLDGPVRWYRLVFRAEGPICCPETPEVAGNAVRSGFAIPASAVRGAILTRLGESDPALATACFEDSRFRAWPLHPAGRSEADRVPAWAVRTSLTHRVSKLPQPRFQCRDHTIEPYSWRDVVSGAPLKAADGVLLRDVQGPIRLWRSADMPRMLSAHAVHAGPGEERNLFTVESMAPLVWMGLIAMPARAGDAWIALVEENPLVFFGKARSVRGAGRLSVEELRPESLVLPDLGPKLTGKVFIAQSPLAIPDEWTVTVAGEAFQRLVLEAGWGEPEGTWASMAVRFGWNRQRLGSTVGRGGRLRGRRCILPGSVVVLKQAPADPFQRLLQGLGTGFQEGYGALLPHPGIAEECWSIPPAHPPVKSVDEAGRLGLRLWEVAGVRGPTSSQIGALLGRVRKDMKGAREYLEDRIQRPSRVWRRWQKVLEPLRKIFSEKPAACAAALRVWQDLRIASGSLEERE